MDYQWYYTAVLEASAILLLLSLFTSREYDAEDFMKSMLSRCCVILFFLVAPIPFMLLGIMWDFRYVVLSIVIAGAAWYFSKNRYSITIRKKEPTNA